MKLLGRRSIAILITVVVVIVATLLGVYSTTGRYTREVEALFYDGIYLEDQGFTQRGINSHLENSANAALGLATLLESYPELSGYAESLLTARRDLMAAGSISAKEQAALEMRDGFINLLETARDVDLIERDKEAAAKFYSTFNGALIAISDSRYNDAVSAHINAQNAVLRLIGYFISADQPAFFTKLSPLYFGEPTWLWERS